MENPIPDIVAYREIFFWRSIMMNEVVTTQFAKNAPLWSILMTGVVNKIVDNIAREKAEEKCGAVMAP
ncbi:hypothetical protein AA0229_0253 [Gluconobacter cerinus NRIC 0229]|nr:hypothetical protein AA0229_0253 [Gluconobacter cerinus NRIC 0229]